MKFVKLVCNLKKVFSVTKTHSHLTHDEVIISLTLNDILFIVRALKVSALGTDSYSEQGVYRELRSDLERIGETVKGKIYNKEMEELLSEEDKGGKKK